MHIMNMKANRQVVRLNESQLKRIIKESVKRTLREGAFDDVDKLWANIVDNNIATEKELQLVTDINGYSIDTLNDVIKAKTGYNTWEQYIGEDLDEED